MILVVSGVVLLNWFLVVEYGEGLIGFFDSNIFIAETTFLVGLFAFFVYYKQKRDKKRDAAKVVLLGIRNIEFGIDRHLKNSSGVGEIDFSAVDPAFLNVNSWDENKHLLVDELSSDEIGLIDDFFQNSKAIKRSLGAFDMIDLLKSKTGGKQNVLLGILDRYLEEVKEGVAGEKDLKLLYQRDLKPLYQIANDKLDELDPYLGFSPVGYKRSIQARVENMVKITATTAGDKLRKISQIN